MKNNIFNIKYWLTASLLVMLAFGLLSTSCKDDNPSLGPIAITKVFLEDVNSKVPDREVSFVRLQQRVRIEGSGLTGLRQIYVNGYKTYFNPVFLTDSYVLLDISKDTPILGVDPAIRNTIRFVNDEYETTFTFSVRSAAPVINNISNTMPLPGETITVSGSGLTEVSKVVFPGNVEVTTGIVSDPKGKFFTVAMPSGVSDDGGALLIECSNGGAYSPAYFNFKKGVLLNFDGQGTQGYWGTSASMIQGTDIESASIGVANLSQGKYVPTLPARITSFAAAKNRCSEVWTAGNGVDDWRGQITPFIPPTTLLTEVAFQFDIFVPQDWTGSGFLKICLVNGFNGGEWAGSCYNYVPWVVDGKAVPFKTTGWTTVTIPFSKFYAYTKEGTTFESILAYREAANYKNLGVYFENSDFTLNKITGLDADKEIAFPSAATSVKVYTDNWRIVSLKTAKYSDFPEDAK